ncbi:hypothetical protein, partial [Flavobacterium sp.]|uniref:hypothetical protein n=1 Tax=Flavobacterium sp. TaxID=239 RepID=UPI0037C0A3D9
MPPKKNHSPTSASAASASAASASQGRTKKIKTETYPLVKPEDIHKLNGIKSDGTYDENDKAVITKIKSELIPQQNTIVYTFGRFQPPTIGHGLLIENVVKLANALHADHGIYVSKSLNNLEKYRGTRMYKKIKDTSTFESHESNKNPLNVYQKMFYMSHMFPNVNLFNTAELYPWQPDKPVSPFDILNNLSNYFGNLVILLGSDRIGESSLINGLKKSANDRGVNMIFVSAGKKRDEKSDSVEGMSGTKLRELAVAGDAENFEKFYKGVNTSTGSMTREIAHNMMNDIRKGLDYDPVPMQGSLQGGV